MRAFFLRYLPWIYLALSWACMMATYITGNYEWMYAMGGLMVGFTMGIIARSQDDEPLNPVT